MANQDLKSVPVKTEIKTMRKDLKKLRNFGFAGSSEKTVKPVIAEQFYKPSIQKTNIVPTENKPKENVVDATKFPQPQPKPPIQSQAQIKTQPQGQPIPPKTVVPPIEQKPPIPKIETRPQPEMKERAFLKEVPPEAKEKLKATAKVEEEQRRKFMEDIEKWASSEKK